jgi:AcrR family transcriptional regulator
MQPELRGRLKKSMLRQVGGLGFHAASAEGICDELGVHPAQFYELFADEAECFAAAYEDEIELLCQEMLAYVRAEQSTATRVEAALGSLAKLATAEPALARALFLEVHVAGNHALAKRQEVVDRLSHAIDQTCRESRPHSPPPLTAEFVVGIIDQAVASALIREAPEELEAAVPELGGILSEILHLERR